MSKVLFGIQVETGPAVLVKLLFSPNLAGYVSERKWPGEITNARATWEGNPNGRRLEMKLVITKDLKRWVLGWGSEVHVLGPPALREAIAATGLELAKRYRE